MGKNSLLCSTDYSIIIAFFIISLIIGLLVTKRAGKNASSFFLGGRNMPWWLLGVSMVATTFSTDTPNLVSNIVRENGVAGNWAWWAFLLTGMTTVFIYAKLWRRTGALTDVEFYEIRYSGKSAAFLRGFRALYLGVFFNIVIMATVTLAAIKIGSVMFGFTPLQTVLIAAVVTTVYSMLGGLTGVLITDFLQFFVAMFGAVAAACYSLNLPQVNGLSGLLSNPDIIKKLDLIPNFSTTDPHTLLLIFIIPIAVQWWATWYPGSEPGGGGYIVQRMLSAKDEKGAVKSTLFFIVAHYALRPWPWIIVALASIAVFPDLSALHNAFPHVSKNVVGNDLAYPAMLVKCLPSGLLGLVVASLIAAYMSTMSTSLNWGSSYIVNDFYKRFINPDATGKQEVLIGRISTVVLMLLSCLLAIFLSTAKEGFDLMLQIGAGTGLIFILRWFWWRINAFTELSAMIFSFALALIFFVYDKLLLNSFQGQALIAKGYSAYEVIIKCGGLEQWQKLLFGVICTTVFWIIITYITPPTDKNTLESFYRLIHPCKYGWRPIVRKAEEEGRELRETTKEDSNLPLGILCSFIGCVTVYSALFATGNWIYGYYLYATLLTLVSVAGLIILSALWSKVV
ncbi:MAG: Na+:solute symporter [Victivallales bacterium]|nr:Na+:solute symporter [Victivallales bacterium]